MLMSECECSQFAHAVVRVAAFQKLVTLISVTQLQVSRALGRRCISGFHAAHGLNDRLETLLVVGLADLFRADLSAIGKGCLDVTVPDIALLQILLDFLQLLDLMRRYF